MATTVVGTSVGGRNGAGTVTVTPPAGSASYLAVVVSGQVVAPSGWTLLAAWADSGSASASPADYNIYQGDAGAGSVWTKSAGSGPMSVVVVGYSTQVTATVVSAASQTSPATTIPGSRMIARVVMDQNDGSAALSYPTAATVSRQQKVQYFATDGYSASAGVAHQTATAGSVASAAWTVPSAYLPRAVTIALEEIVLPDTPTGLTVTGADHGLSIEFDPVAGADSYTVEWRRTDLTPPSLVTQSSAPSHLDRIDDTTGTDGTYTYTWDGTGVRVYMIDRGIRATHNEFVGRVETGFTVGSDPWDTDTTNHGTGTSSMAVGTTYGVAKGARVVMISPGTPPSTPIYLAELTEIVDFILADHAAHGGPGVVNCSLYLLGIDSPDDPDATDALAQYQRFLDAGLPITFAIGNDGTDRSSVVYKAPNGMLLVGCSTTADAKRDTSNYASNMAVFAPSASTVFASNVSNSATQSGGATSEAAPMIAGLIAKILQANPELSPDRVREVVTSQAFPVLTGVPVGPPLQMNGNANTNQWSRHSTTATSFTLDGLDGDADYEIRVTTVDGAQASAPSSAESATTLVALVTGTINTPTPPGTVAPPSVAWSGAVSAPVAGALDATTPTVQTAPPTASWGGTATAPTFAGTVTADTPVVAVTAPSVAWGGTVAVPSFTGDLTDSTPTVQVGPVTAVWTAAGTVPAAAGLLAADTADVTLDPVGAAWAGASTVPVFDGQADAATPPVAVGVPSLTWVGAVSAPGAFAGTITADTPAVTVQVQAEWSGAVTLPAGAGGLTAPTPLVEVTPPVTEWSGTVLSTTMGGLAATAPTVTVRPPVVVWAGDGTAPTVAGLLAADTPAVTVATESAWVSPRNVWLGDYPVSVRIGDYPALLNW